ncbi:hypothetical protein HK096_002213, partial [Nowakowskiella sp. JEL0078]
MSLSRHNSLTDRSSNADFEFLLDSYSQTTAEAILEPKNTKNSSIEELSADNIPVKSTYVADFASFGSLEDSKISAFSQNKIFLKSNPESSTQDISKITFGLSYPPMDSSSTSNVPSDLVTPYSQNNNIIIQSDIRGNYSEHTIRAVKSASNFEGPNNKSSSRSYARSRPRTSVRPLSTKIKLRKQSSYNPPTSQNESETQNSNAIISDELKMSPVQIFNQSEISTVSEFDVEHSFLLKPENLTFHISTYPYSAGKNDELAFQEGQIIRVIRQVVGGWWEGQLDQQIGWFPENYTEPFSIEGLSEEDTQKFTYDQFANTDEDIDALRSRNIVKNIKDKEDDSISESEDHEKI